LPRDPKVDEAIGRLRQFFGDNPQRLFYSTQIETSFEREFFHWIIGRGLLEMGDAREITRIIEMVVGQRVHFYASRRHRYVRRELKKMISILRRLFDPDFLQAIGRHGELMFDAALGRHGFQAEAKDTKNWKDRTWQETNHNLDRIITKDGLSYGVEIKNTQNYISRGELRLKIRMCKYLQLAPLFIMRFAPKSYMYEDIYLSGGFGLLFEKQIYPWGHSALLQEAREHLLLKVQCPRDVPEGDMQRLLNWHHYLLKSR
jgi:hypothetical protein